MRLQTLRIKNFRSFGPKETDPFDLDHTVVLFYGGNGSGKSSLFDALEMALLGTVQRFENHSDLFRLLVNARHPNESTSLNIRWLDDTVSHDLEIPVSPGAVSSGDSAVLHGHQRHLFQNTSYLLQSDIRRLLTAGSSNLGEIIEKLVVDDQIDLLIRGLAEANISRNDPSYQRVKYEMDQLSLDLERVTKGIEEQEKTITSIQDSRLSLSDVTRKLKDVRRALDIEEPSQKVANLEDVSIVAKELDRALQKQLRISIETQSAAERAMAQAIFLGNEQNGLQSSQRELQQSDASGQVIQKQLADLRAEIQTAKKNLQKTQSAASSRSSIPTIIQTLSAASELEDLDSCPVCDRPFPNLREHIRRKLLRLNKEQTTLEKTVTDTQARLVRIQNRESDLKRLLDRAKEQSTLLQQQIESTQKRLQSFLSRYTAQFDQIQDLKAIEAHEKTRLEAAKGDYQRLSMLTETLLRLQSDIMAASSGLSQQQNSLRTSSVRAVEIRKRWQAKKDAFDRLNAFIQATHEARGKLSDRVEELLNEFVQGRTKMAFEDMFRRIARHPYFDVTIPISRVKYHRPEVNWVASYRGQQLPGDAVFSQGQLNACALSFFLALATTQPHHLGFLLLDDPVQNMDEIHIEEFANVLKAVKDLLGWQLVLAVHEESLFNYLKRILYPSEPSQSLIAYRLTAGKDGTEIQSSDKFDFDSKVFSFSSAESTSPSR